MIINKVVDFLRTCPLLEEYQIKVDYLGEEAGNFAVYPQPCNPIVKKYADGGTVRQCLFAFTSRDYLDCTDEQNTENQMFFEKLSGWFEECSETGKLPALEEGTAQRIEAVDSGYLLSDDVKTGAYQIQCKLIYYVD